MDWDDIIWDQNGIKGSEWNQRIRMESEDQNGSRDQNGIRGSKWNQGIRMRIRMESKDQNKIKGSRWPLNFNQSKTPRRHSYHSVLWTTVNHVIKNFGRIKWSSTIFIQSRLLIPHHPSRQSTVNIWLPLGGFNLASPSLSEPSHNSVFDSLETRLTWY